MKSISIAEPVSELRRVRIIECGEEMMDFLALCPGLLLDKPHFDYQRVNFMRKSLAEKICLANRSLPKGYLLAIVEGWRPPYIQRRMYTTVWNKFREDNPGWSDVKMKRVVNRYTAPMNARVPPPHTTGGAVDVLLANEAGIVLDHCSPFDRFDPKCFGMNTPGLSETALEVRDILSTAMLSTGLTNYPSEFWHWSYGDQGWAYRGGHPNALYAAISPPGFESDHDDNINAPLEFTINSTE